MGVIFQWCVVFDEVLFGVYQLGDFQLWGYGFDQKQWMGGQVVQYIVGVDEVGIDLLVGIGVFLFYWLGVKIVGKLYINDMDIVQQFVGDYLLGLQDQLVVGIVVGYFDDFVLLLVECYQFVSFFVVEVQWFFVYYVQFGFQCGLVYGIVGVIWCGN